MLFHYLITYGPAFISGALLVLCFPTMDLFLIAWIALVPLILSLYAKQPKEAFRTGMVFGLPYFFGTLYWISHSINHFGGVSFVSSILIVVLLSLYLSLYTGIFALCFSLAINRTKLPALLIAPAFWVVLEFLRSYLFTGFPWSSIGYTQYSFLTMIQIADITGVYGVSFLVIAVNGAVADIFLIKRRTNDMPLFPLSQTIIGTAFLVIFLIASVVYGQIRLCEQRPGEAIRVSVVQGNIEQDKKWEPTYQNEVIGIYQGLSLEAAAKSPSLIIWPESAVPFLFKSDEKYTRELIEFQKRLNTFLLFGSVLVKEQTGKGYLLANSAVLLDENGTVSYVYDKIHLVPFGEYVPLRKLFFFLNKLVVGIGDYVPGDSHLKAMTPHGKFATLICYEAVFPGLVRKFFAGGGDFMVNITNDAWFGRTTGPYQHFAIAVFRAVENRKPLIRAANTGISGFVDSNGRILARTGLFQRTVLTGEVRTDTTMSFYSKYGDLFSYIWIIFSVVLLVNIMGKPRNT